MSIKIKIVPGKITPNQEYIVEVPKSWNDKSVDYELTTAKLDFSDRQDSSGVWQAKNGKITVSPPEGGFRVGICMVRLKQNKSEWSNYDVLVVDNLPTAPPVQYTAQKISLPPLGSYMLFKNYNAQGNFIGYTRIDIETDPSSLGGYTMRFTKTRSCAYWNAGFPSQLRWYLKEEDTPQGKLLLALGGTSYGVKEGGSLNKTAQQIKVTYSRTGLEDAATQGMLGGFSTEKFATDYYLKDEDMAAHYSLLPPDRKIPANLSSTPLTIFELLFGHPLPENGGYNESGMDIWHLEALKSVVSGSAITMRYIEYAARKLLSVPNWSVTEDWTWRADGLLSQITQYVNVERKCWETPYSCTADRPLIKKEHLSCSNSQPLVRAELFDWYIPDREPLLLRLRSAFDPTNRSNLTIKNGEEYDLFVKKSDGRPYSGFLEVKTSSGSQLLWRDKDNHPIYVSNGLVTVGPAAYGNLPNFSLTFAVRPYLTCSSLNSAYPVDLENLYSNKSLAAFSNLVTLNIR
ncbi:MAG: hypothetical protein F6K23_25185 [Okeania sp. SIO2C9]|uniref:hypothetical protein n=1 Tax=Okeania sp. SIO2C9 TaxID=2607791 RepID=UPI0013C2130D|nr:hypothetical protein [Okeania sp. SIO2C9]NEQ76041.1 hypothetical protein [Okeania sp. SIO2C9]